MQDIFQSTHPWRVRLIILDESKIDPIFQSTHPWRVRHHDDWRRSWIAHFNPRTHEECDQVYGRTAALMTRFQSTHPWRVRLFLCNSNFLIEDFNPRTHEECDFAISFTYPHCRKFQSTHPWRVRHEWLKDRSLFSISIHAPMKSATDCQMTHARCVFISIHAPMKSATFISRVKTALGKAFQSTHPWRVRHETRKRND